METKNTMPTKGKILYAIHFSPQDRNQAMALARLIADIGPAGQDKMDFMFCPRFDAVVDTKTEACIREKFGEARTFQCRNIASGWPKAPNCMVHEIYTMFAAKCASKEWEYDAIFFGEPDCVPLSRDWIEKIWTEWHVCNWNWPIGNNQLVLGHWLTKRGNDSGFPHINGNCLISPKLVNAYPAFGKVVLGAWDFTHAKQVLPHARPSKLIFSDYCIGGINRKRPFLGCEDMFKTRFIDGPFPIIKEETHPVYLHGIKDIRSIACVRKVLGVPNSLGDDPIPVPVIPQNRIPQNRLDIPAILTHFRQLPRK